MQKRIVLGLDSWFPHVAGPNVVITNYCKYLMESGNSCRIFVPTYGKKIDSQYKFPGLDIVHVPSAYIPFGGYRNGHPENCKILNETAKYGVDIFHAHSPFAMCSRFAHLGKKYHTPTILTFHTKFKDEFLRVTESEVLTDFMMKRMMKAINSVDYVFTVSDGAAETLREYGYEKPVTVIRNGTDMVAPSPEKAAELVAAVNEKYNLSDVKNVFLFVGRIVSTKNLPLVFNALSILKRRGEKFKFIVVGDGESLEEYKEFCAGTNIYNDVIFPGMVTDREMLKAFYLRADLFLFPSEFDTASLCPLEASAFSLPTLLIKNSPTAEIVEDGCTGYTEADDAKKWAEKLKKIVGDKKALQTVRENVAKRVYRSWKDVVAEVEANYDEIIQRYKIENHDKI